MSNAPKARLAIGTWTADMVRQLRIGAEEAQRLNIRTFEVDLNRKLRGVRFNLNEALDTLAAIEPDFEANPPRVYPENREGEEP